MDNFDLIDPSFGGTWERISSSDGLAGDDIRDIFLDSRGDIWVACYGSGISKFDGFSWITYNTSNSGLLSNNVRCIGEDGDGDMLFGLSDGISFLLDGTDWQYFFDIDREYRVNTFKLAGNGWMWAGCDGGGYIVYDGSGLYTSELSTIVEHNVINCIEEDSQGNIWLATDDGVLIWNGSSWSWQSVEYGLGTDIIWSLLSDSKGRMWIGTQGGFTVVYSESFTLYPVSLLNGGNDVYIKDILEDRKGDIWFATWFDGLVRFDGVVSEAFKEYNGFPDDYVETVAADSKGNIWAGTSSGIAMYHLPVTIK
ncbi:MAG: two-component regulator propeller domain-containing protein [Bacteroidales bacterium]